MNTSYIEVACRRGLLCAFFIVASLSIAFSQIVSSASLRGLEDERNVGDALLLPTYRAPAFDTDSARMSMEQASAELRLYIFAHKLLQEVDVIKEGQHEQLSDGTQIWRYRIRSAGAKSLSFFFDQFELPEGGLLYIYDSFRPENKIGGFGAINNNDRKVLSTMPIAADDVVIEVQASPGILPVIRLREINHGVRDLSLARLSIPKYEMGGVKALACTPELACNTSYLDMGRSVVLIAFGGTAMGTGTLVNNTSGDGAPLILTAAHVMSANFHSNNIEKNAQSTVVFFNYTSPTCSGEIAPNTVQTLSVASLIGYQPKTDVALLKMSQKPPRDYNAFYAGWNASNKIFGPFVNIHHPAAYSKRFNLFDSIDISITTYPASSLPFAPQQHLRVTAWTAGTTAPGSSGSPLFDRNNLVVGGLSGGMSYCDVKSSDYFFSLQKLWEREDTESNNIINALDPSGKRQTLCYGSVAKEVKTEPTKRITNISIGAGESIRDNMPQLSRDELLGESGGATMIGEHYRLRGNTKVHGLYMMVSMMSDEVDALSDDDAIEVVVYSDEGQKEIGKGQIKVKSGFPLLREKNGVVEKRPMMAELYLSFPQPLLVSTDGGVIFALKSTSIPDKLIPLHQQHQDPNRNTLYRMSGDSWVRSSRSVSLWIDPRISHPYISNENEPQPFVRMENFHGHSILITLPEPDEHENKIDIYTLQGQRLYSADIYGGKHLLPRAPFEGIGVVLLHIQVGDHEETLKVLLPVSD